MEREFHFHCSSFSEEAKWRSLAGTEADKEHSWTFCFNLLPTCCFLPFLLSTSCLALPLSWSDSSGACLAAVLGSDLMRQLQLCSSSLQHCSQSVPRKQESPGHRDAAIEFFSASKLRVSAHSSPWTHFIFVHLWPSKSCHRGVASDQQDLLMLIHLGAVQPTWWSTACPQQLLHIHRTSPSLSCSGFYPFLLQHHQHFHPPKGSRRALAGAHRQLAGTAQPQPLPKLVCFGAQACFCKSLPQEHISNRAFKSLAFSLPRWPAFCWFTSQIPAWDPPSHLLFSLAVYSVNVMVSTLAWPIPAHSILSLLPAQVAWASNAESV